MDTTSSSSVWVNRSTKAWVFAAAVLAGCAPMTETECRSANWYELGSRDGITGLRPQIDQYVHQCSASKVKVADGAYMTGWQHGKWEYDRRVHGSDCCSPP